MLLGVPSLASTRLVLASSIPTPLHFFCSFSSDTNAGPACRPNVRNLRLLYNCLRAKHVSIPYSRYAAQLPRGSLRSPVPPHNCNCLGQHLTTPTVPSQQGLKATMQACNRPIILRAAAGLSARAYIVSKSACTSSPAIRPMPYDLIQTSCPLLPTQPWPRAPELAPSPRLPCPWPAPLA